jgi:hypothetical protein
VISRVRSKYADVAATTWRAGFALVALFPLAGYVVLRRVA